MEDEMEKWMKERLAEAKKFQNFKDAEAYAKTIKAPRIWQNPKDKGEGYIVTDMTQTEAAYRAGYKSIGTAPIRDDDSIDEIEEA